jgi:maltooligosyltrehalose trehalohydrolase
VTGFGAEVLADGVRFRFWAPLSERVHLHLVADDRTLPMEAAAEGWHDLFVAGLAPGALYRFVLPDGRRVPDPASRFQPEDVHGPSEVVDPRAYAWHDGGWRGRPFEECVAYELHVGTFTPEGTFAAAADRLADLAQLGITAVSLMPLADFPGRWNWGYDGVLLFAPDSSYGRPDDLRAFVDRAHGLGLMVFLDVVYNHFGPEGNYLAAYAPFFTDRHTTPWGVAVNYDGAESRHVRAFIAANAAHWLAEYHIDGFRLDAVHAIHDATTPHVLEEIATTARRTAGERIIHLILENEENTVSLLERDAAGRPKHFTAQWNDDLHHLLHVTATGEAAGYYGEYLGRIDLLGRALAEGFAFQGETMVYRGRPRGEPSAGLPPTAFVSFIQNHDQIGNRAFGDRLAGLAPAPAVRAVSAIYLLAPQIPMLFMGEEWGATQPFFYFTDFAGDLAEAVRAGRRAEFARFPEFNDPEARLRIPDPNAAGTFMAAKLRWADAGSGTGRDWRDWYRRILAVRHAEIVPLLAALGGHAGSHEVLDTGVLRVRWRLADGRTLELAANLADATRPVPPAVAGRTLWVEGEGGDERMGPWSIVWTLTGGEP